LILSEPGMFCGWCTVLFLHSMVIFNCLL